MRHRLDTSASGPARTYRRLIDEHERHTTPRLERLWAYYRNALEPVAQAGGTGRWYYLAQESALPSRFGARRDPSRDDRAASRREIVVENDIAWRVHAMVDFMVSRSVRFVSRARDPGLRTRIERVLDAAWEGSGGSGLLHDMALLGHVYGHVDLLLRLDEPVLLLASGEQSDESLSRLAEALRVEVIEPTRGVPFLDARDYRTMRGYVIGARIAGDEPRGWENRTDRRAMEIFEPGRWRLIEDDRLVDEAESRLLPGAIPVAHIQNVAQPFRYEGLGEVEPLIPMQDELNTRLSDRANRVTMQSFKMYLVRGMDGFEQVPVGPGQIWMTDNPEASVEAFGGDASSPSEDAHILDVREAMDKVSGVPPLAAGVVRAKLGNLSSANALRVTLMGLITRTERKRRTYGRGLEHICTLMLEALDRAGLLRTDPLDRAVRVEWPDPLAVDPREQVDAARSKANLGVPHETVMRELGYGPEESQID
ncbi:MAG: phage portal protein [Phycisphaerales bacterium]|nr:phage portal protein [Phycisphaerales bacterium]